MKNIEENRVLKCLNILNVYGYTKVEGVLDNLEIDKLKSIIEQHYEIINKSKKHKYGGVRQRDTQDKILCNLQNKIHINNSILAHLQP